VYGLMSALVDRLDRHFAQDTCVIPWSCPVPFFGGLSSATVGTVGINPSQREFIDPLGRELNGGQRRLPTLTSLGLNRWGQADAFHLRCITAGCSSYFERNPYDRWFGVLERILAPAGHSLYGGAPSACHLDLVPFATRRRWTNLSPCDRRDLLNECGELFAALLRVSELEVLILNGQSVVDQFEVLVNERLQVRRVTEWNLQRQSSGPVLGLCYSGQVDAIGHVSLPKSVRVLGFNHNLQSSFGVSSNVIDDIGHWIARSTRQ
jgi:hypothetical protein